MNKKALLYIIDDPAKINDVTLDSLEDITERFPYFQVAHVLLAKGSQEVEPVQAPNKIRRAAVYAYNRNLLRELLSYEGKSGKSAKNGSNETGFEHEEVATVEDETVSFFDAIEEKEENVTLDTFPNENKVVDTPPVANQSISLDFDEGQDEYYAIDLYNNGKIEEAKQHFHKLILRYPDKKEYYITQANLLMDNTYVFDESLVVSQPVREQEPEAKDADTQEPENQDESVTSNTDDNSENTTESFFEQIAIDSTDEDVQQEIADDGHSEKSEQTIEETQVLAEESATEISDQEKTTVEEQSENLAESVFPEDRVITDDNVDLTGKIVIDLGQELDEYEAVELYNEGKLEEARAHFDRLILRYPGKKEYFLTQANLLLDGTYQFDESLAEKVYYKKPKQEEKTPVVEEVEEEEVNVPIPGAQDLGHPEWEDTFDLLREEVTPTTKKTLEIDTEDLNEDVAIEYYKNGETELAGMVYQKLMQKYPTRKEYFQTQYELLTKNPRLFGIGIDDVPSVSEQQSSKTEEEPTNNDDEGSNLSSDEESPPSNVVVSDISSEEEFYVDVQLPNDFVPYNPLLLNDPFELVRDENFVLDSFDILRDKLEYDLSAKVTHNDVIEPLPAIDLSEEQAEVVSEEVIEQTEENIEVNSEQIGEVSDSAVTEAVVIEEEAVAEMVDGSDNETEVIPDDLEEAPVDIDLFDQVRDLETELLTGKPHSEEDDDLDLFEFVRHWEKGQIDGEVVNDDQVEDGSDIFEAVRGWETEQIEGTVVNDDQVEDGFDAFEAVRGWETEQIEGTVVHDDQVEDGSDIFEAVRGWETEQIEGTVVNDDQVEDGFDAFEAVRGWETEQIEGTVVHDDQVEDGSDIFEAVRGWESEQIEGTVVNDDQVEDGFDAFEAVRGWETEQIEGTVVHDDQVEDGSDIFEAVRGWESEQIEGTVVNDDQVEDGFDAFEAVRGWETEQIEGTVVHDDQVEDGSDIFEAVRSWESEQIEGTVVNDDQVEDGFDAFEAVRGWETEQIEGTVVHDDQVEDGSDIFEAVRGWESEQIEGTVVNDDQVEDGFDAFEAVRGWETEQIEGTVVHDEQVEDGFDAFEAVRGWETEQLESNVSEQSQVENIQEDAPLDLDEEEPTTIPVIEEDENLNEGIAMDLFNEGRTKEAITMYKQLIERHPEKKAYYEGQLEIISDGVDLDFFEEESDTSVSETPENSVQSPIVEDHQQEEGSSKVDVIEELDKVDDNSKEETIAEIIKPIEEEPEKIITEDKQDQKSDIAENTPDFFQSIDTEAYLEPENIQPEVFEQKPIVDEPTGQTEEVATNRGDAASESAAIFLFNQGRNEEAIEIYRRLMDQQPERSDYFLAQISILQNEPFITEEASTQKDNGSEESKVEEDTIETEEEDFVSESMALILFNQGKLDEAIQVFERLKEQYPEKAAHFDSQIDILRS